MCLHGNQRLIANEVKDLKKRDGLRIKDGVENVHLWLEVHDIVKVFTSSDDGSEQFEYAIVR